MILLSILVALLYGSYAITFLFFAHGFNKLQDEIESLRKELFTYKNLQK